MFDVFLANLVTYGLNQNILIINGYGALVLGREKKYRFFLKKPNNGYEKL